MLPYILVYSRISLCIGQYPCRHCSSSFGTGGHLLHVLWEQLSPVLLLYSHKATGTCGACSPYKSPCLSCSGRVAGPRVMKYTPSASRLTTQLWHGHWVQVWPDMYMGPAQEAHHWRDSGKAVIFCPSHYSSPFSLFGSFLYFFLFSFQLLL